MNDAETLEQKLARVRGKQPKRPPAPPETYGYRKPTTPPGGTVVSTKPVDNYGRSDIGNEKSVAAAGAEWFDEAMTELKKYLEGHPFCHVDSLRTYLPHTANMRAIGQVLRTAKNRGWIEHARPSNAHMFPDGAIVALPSEQSNGAPKPIWRSTLYGVTQ